MEPQLHVRIINQFVSVKLAIHNNMGLGQKDLDYSQTSVEYSFLVGLSLFHKDQLKTVLTRFEIGVILLTVFACPDCHWRSPPWSEWSGYLVNCCRVWTSETPTVFFSLLNYVTL